MGIYLNPNNTNFQMALNSEIFVDKTNLIGYLNVLVNTNKRYVSVSRPRRFGKTMTADMICAYYDRLNEGSDIFSTCLIREHRLYKTHIYKYDVIRIVMTEFIKKEIPVRESLRKLVMRILGEFHDKYPEMIYDENDFSYSLNKFYQYSGHQYVIVIDEWDAVFRIRKNDKKGQTEYLDFLRECLKDKAYVALAYMTGILPIKKYGEHSALNMFDEYSMIQPMQLARYTAFTDDEVKVLCKRYGRNFNSIKDWYDGYNVSDIVPPDTNHELLNTTGMSPAATRYSLYSPLSVVNAVTNGQIRNYWNKTETYEALAEYIRMDFDGLKECITILMDGNRVKIDTSSYQNDMTTFNNKDDVLSLLIHLGYLAFDDEKGEVYIPNREILEEFRTSTKSTEWNKTFVAYERSKELLKATWECDEEKVAELLEYFHNYAENKTYNSEAALSYSVQLAYYSAQRYYTTALEFDTGKGYADIVYLPLVDSPDRPVLLIELKYRKNSGMALSQITKQRYFERLEKYRGNILLIGINYNPDLKNTDAQYKHHTCQIVRV